MQLSIIVPIYNADKYLTKCLDSVKNIKNIEFECLMIDDGSNDASGDICKKYTTDKRFKYVRKNNSGVSSTRNYGIKEAVGEYLFFLDADDYLIDNIDDLITDAMAMNVEFTIFDYIINADGKKTYKMIKQNKDNALDDVIHKIYCTSELNTCWGKLFKREIIKRNKLEFMDNIKIGEDQIFVMQYINLIESAEFINKEILTYRINKFSAMNNYDPNERLSDLKKCYYIMKDTPIAKNNEKLFIEANYSFFREVAYYFRQIAKKNSLYNYLKIYKKNINDKVVKEIIGITKESCGMNSVKKIELILMKSNLMIGGLYFYLKGKLYNHI